MTLSIWGVAGIPEVRPGDDLAALLAAAEPDLATGDVVVVTSKVVSKAEGRLVAGTRDDYLPAETVREVAARGPMRIVETRHGLVMAAAGIDASNVPGGYVALLPLDPDASAARIRAGLRERLGVAVAVLVTDTAGRPWRDGLVDIAIGAAGIDVVTDLRGRHDDAGHRLEATVVAVADEIAAATDLVKGKLSATPIAVVRGYPFAPDASGRGARRLIRPAADDLFRLGTRESRVRLLAESRPVDDVVGEVNEAAVRRAVDAVDSSDVRLDIRDGGRQVTASGDPLMVGLTLGRLLAALAVEGLCAEAPRPTADATTATMRIGHSSS